MFCTTSAFQVQVVTQELAQSLCAGTQELLELKNKHCCAASIPLPDLFQEAPGILTKLPSKDDVEAFLLTFGQVA